MTTLAAGSGNPELDGWIILAVIILASLLSVGTSIESWLFRRREARRNPEQGREGPHDREDLT
jgi:hypothetical protein